VPQPVDRYTWQQQICGEHGPNNSTARLILLAISLHMNADGSGAWPSQKTIAARALVTDRAVRKHLEIAVRHGWLARSIAGRNGQGWALHEYGAVVPDAVYDHIPEKPWEADPKWERGERRSPPVAAKGAEPYSARSDSQAEGAERSTSKVRNGEAEGAERSDAKVRNHVPTNLPSENLPSRTIPKRERALARTALSFESSKTKTKAEEAERAIRRYLIGGYSAAEIVTLTKGHYGVTIEDVQRVEAEEREGEPREAEDRERRKGEAIIALLQNGNTWDDIVKFTHSYGTTRDDVAKYEAIWRKTNAQWEQSHDEF
jgi:hypothetical protein